MISHPTLQLKDFIKVYDNVLDLDVCKNIVETSKDTEFPRAYVGAGDYATQSKNRNCYSKKLNKEFETTIYSTVGKILKLYEIISYC